MMMMMIMIMDLKNEQNQLRGWKKTHEKYAYNQIKFLRWQEVYEKQKPLMIMILESFSIHKRINNIWSKLFLWSIGSTHQHKYSKFGVIWCLCKIMDRDIYQLTLCICTIFKFLIKLNANYYDIEVSIRWTIRSVKYALI